MINKFLLIGGGLAVAGTGTGVGIYYGTQGSGNGEKSKSPAEGRQTHAEDGAENDAEDEQQTGDGSEDLVELPAP